MASAKSASITLEKFIRKADASNSAKVIRDKKNRAILVDESVLDFEKITRLGLPLISLGRRLRLYSADMQQELGRWIAPVELTALSKEDPGSVAGVATPLGKVMSDHGLWLKYNEGIEEVGSNDRSDVILRLKAGDRSGINPGPVINSANTIIAGRAKRLVTRLDVGAHDADKKEAAAWLKAFELADGKKSLRSNFKCAGIDYLHQGNVPYLYRTTQLNFFDPADKEMNQIARDVRRRFKAIRRQVPSVTVISLLGVPKDEKSYGAFLRRVKAKGKNPAKLGLPAKLDQSQFYDPESKSVVSSNFVYFAPLSQLPDQITIITVNTDYHGEVKSRGVLSPLMAIMSLAGIISAHAGSAVLNQKGTATTFTGPTGTGKTTAGAFWSEKNEKYRRNELRRRYEIDLRRAFPDWNNEQILKRLGEIMRNVGILCQEDWIEISKTGEREWHFWPTERMMYARTGGFPGLRFILSENQPLLENATADFGGSGNPDNLGRVTHDYFPERLFYDPTWNHLLYDRRPRQITANVFLERNAKLDFAVKRVSAEEASRWLLLGRTPDGKFEPLYNAYPDFSGLLMHYGVVGEKLLDAYDAARKGDVSRLANGDAVVGRAIFEKLDIQVRLWLDNCRVISTYIVNGAPGLEFTQDMNWLLSEHPEAFGDENDPDGWKHVTYDDFTKYMSETYGVTYGERGAWSHISAAERRS